MRQNPHPTYRNPTIVEAICEIQFRPAPESTWNSNRPGELFRLVQGEFPEIEPIPGTQLEFSIGPNGPIQRVKQLPLRIRFLNEGGTRLFQVSESSFAFSVVKDYPGWLKVKADIMGAWANVASVLKPESVSRIGLRYVNRFQRSKDTPNLSGWLRPTQMLPVALIESEAGHSARVEARPDSNHRLVITLVDELANEADPFGSTIFDIDHVWIGESDANSDLIVNVIDELHEVIWQEFEAAKSDRLTAHLEGQAN